MENLTHEYLKNLGESFGTPLYVYHAESIKDQYYKLSHAFRNSDAKIFYACKSLTNINVLKYIHGLGASLDCVSINEAGFACWLSKKEYPVHTQLCRFSGDT